MNYKNKLFMTKRKAFTLIELLIVIAIIGILFIVLVSKVDFATDKAKAAGVQTDFRSFQMAFETVSRENAGFATFGWDTGDLNGNGKKDTYDEGDANRDGVKDTGEVWTGHKVPGETWTNIYTLTNPADANDNSSVAALESAINKNLDPKLHITIHDDLTITMANGAQDPWKTEYHGYYITNATMDNKDRGAIVMYSNGANKEFGSEHSIANGVVTVNVPGNNVHGKDDYSIAVVYTYANGYGEVKTSTSGFSNNVGTIPSDLPTSNSPIIASSLSLNTTYSCPPPSILHCEQVHFVFADDGRVEIWLELESDSGLFTMSWGCQELEKKAYSYEITDNNITIYDNGAPIMSGVYNGLNDTVTLNLFGEEYIATKTNLPWDSNVYDNVFYSTTDPDAPAFKIAQDGTLLDINGNAFTDNSYVFVNGGFTTNKPNNFAAILSMDGTSILAEGVGADIVVIYKTK